MTTAIFTATYNAQSKLDVASMVGSDVAVVEPPRAVVGPYETIRLQSAPHVDAIEPLQHRLAYVASDLQDLYGIRPTQTGKVAPLRNSVFPGSSSKAALHALATTPHGVLLSAETLKDYQLHPGTPSGSASKTAAITITDRRHFR